MVGHAVSLGVRAMLASLSLPVAGQSVAPTPLTLSDLLTTVDRTFPKLISARLERNLAGFKAQEKRGAFDPIFTADTNYLRYNSSSTPGKALETSFSSTTVDILSRGGVKYQVGARFAAGNIKSPGSSAGSFGEYFVSAKIPILRDRLVNAKAISEQQAILGETLADQLIREFRNETFFKAGKAYIDWVAAGEKLAIATKLRDVARIRAGYIKERADKGAIPRIDASEAEAEVFRRQGLLEQAERDLQRSEILLQQFRWPESGAPTETRLARVQLPNFATIISQSGFRAAQFEPIALIDRPELLALRVSRDVLGLDLELAKNERRPALDFIVGPGSDFGNRAIGATIKAGVFYSIPLVQNTADGRIGQANLKLRKLDLEESMLIQSVRLELADAESAAVQAERRVQAAKEEVAANKTLEEGELIRFELGAGNLFLVNQRERARAEAEVRLVDAEAALSGANLTMLYAAAMLEPDAVIRTWGGSR